MWFVPHYVPLSLAGFLRQRVAMQMQIPLGYIHLQKVSANVGSWGLANILRKNKYIGYLKNKKSLCSPVANGPKPGGWGTF